MARKVQFPHALPESSVQSLEALGSNLLVAIKRRGLRRQDVADRALISEPTLRRVLRGDASTSMAAYLAVLSVLGLSAELERVAHPMSDEVGQALELRNLAQRVSRRASQYDF